MKTCSHCKEEKDESLFSKKQSSKDGLQSWCNKCVSVKVNARYHQNKAGLRKCSKKRILRNQLWLDEIKQAAGCIACREEDPCGLDFHHVNPEDKDRDLAKLASAKSSIEKLQSEVDKCIVICAVCHRKLHKGNILMVITNT